MTLEFHPLANLFPLIDGAEFEALVEGMRRDGYRSGEEIVLHEGKILDGRNRYRAAVAAGILDPDNTADWNFVQFSTEGIDGLFTTAEVEAGPLAYVLAKNLNRRHLNESQRAMVAARLASMRQGERTDLQPSANLPKVAQADAATKLSVSPRSVQGARAVQEKGSPALIAAVDGGRMAVSLAAQAAKLSPEQQTLVVDEVNAGHANAVRTVVKRAARAAKEQALGAKQLALPDKRYGVIYADPEWRFEPRSRETGLDRAPDNHYPTSELEAIKARPVGEIAAENCALLLWATAPMLPQALAVMAAWGFDYKTHCMWLKMRRGAQCGPGYWFTAEHELLLLGTRGSVPAPAPGMQWRSVIEAPVGGHSAKPEQFRTLIEDYFPNLPKIELNARVAAPGWDAWGLEAPASNEASAQGEAQDTSGEDGGTHADEAAATERRGDVPPTQPGVLRAIDDFEIPEFLRRQA